MDNRLSLYKERSLSMCVEATFDFIRDHTKAWLRLGAVFLLPVCVLLSLNVFMIDNEEFLTNTRWSLGLTSEHKIPWLYGLLMVVGLWMALMLIGTLLLAEREEAHTDNLRQLTPYMRRIFWSSMVSSMMLSILLWTFGLSVSWVWGIVAVILFVPMTLVPPVWMMENSSRATAITKALRLGFSSWFTLFFMIIMVALIGFIVVLVVNVPWIIFQTVITEIIPINEDGDSGLFFFRCAMFLFTVLAYFCCFMMTSLVLLSCVFHYGSVSEKIDDTSLESDIEHFEQLG